MWLLFSQISALTETAATFLAKKTMASYDSAVVSWFWVTTSLLLLGAVVLFTGIPTIQPVFYTIIFLRIVTDTVALLLYTKALQLEEISLVTPLINFSAIFSLFFSFFINKELPSFLGIVGVFLIVGGAYALNFESRDKGFLHPVQNVLKNRGAKFMLTSATLFGFIFTISKIGIESSSLSFYTFSAALGLSFSIFPIAYLRNKKDLFRILSPKNAIKVLPLGLIDGVKILALMATLQITYVGFADAANNTSILYNQAAAKFLLKEKVRERIIPVIIMFVGLLAIGLS